MAIWRSDPAELQRVFDEQNPWRASGIVPSTLARPEERSLAALLADRLLRDDPHRYQLVLGPRRVGKTTAMYQTARRLLVAGVPPSRVWWLRLDHPLLLAEPLDSLVRGACEAGRATEFAPVHLLLDELVYARESCG